MPFNCICTLNFFSYIPHVLSNQEHLRSYLIYPVTLYHHLAWPANLQTFTYAVLQFPSTYSIPVRLSSLQLGPKLDQRLVVHLAFSLSFCLYLMVDPQWDSSWGSGISCYFRRLQVL